MREMRRKCFKCGCSPAKDPSVFLYRFPKPGKTNSLRCELWAKYVFPNGPWSSPIFQQKLHSEHRMLCDKHFKHTAFLDFRTKRMGKFGAPDLEAYGLINQKKHFVDNTHGNTEDVEPNKVADNIDYNADDDDNDDVIPETQLFSWQKDSEVNCDDLDYDLAVQTLMPGEAVVIDEQFPSTSADSPTRQVHMTTKYITPKKRDSNVKQAENCQSIKEPFPKTEKQKNSDEKDDLHEGYRCDMCEGSIYKFRYTCVQCVNFDLCGACEGHTAHAHHYLLRVPGPKPYGEIKQVMDTIRRILSADIKSFQTEAYYANELLDDMKTEVVSVAGSDPCPDEPDFALSRDDSSCEEDIEMCSYSNPSPSRNIIASHEPKTKNEGEDDGNTMSTPQTHIDLADDVDETEIDWLDDDILEECEMAYQSCNTNNTENTETNTKSNDQHMKLINESYHSELKPAKREENKIDNRLSPSNASGKVSKRLVYGVVKLPNVASKSIDVAKIVKTIKHSLETKVCINMERLSDEEIKLATNS